MLLLNRRQLIGALIIAISLFTFLGFVLPRYNAMGELRTALQERQAKYAERKDVIANIKVLAEEYKNHSADIGRISQVIPDKKSTAEILSALETVSLRNGIQILDFSIRDRSSAGSDLYTTSDLSMTIEGGYANISNFFQSLEKSLRLVDITKLEISPTDGQNLTARIEASAYYLK